MTASASCGSPSYPLLHPKTRFGNTRDTKLSYDVYERAFTKDDMTQQARAAREEVQVMLSTSLLSPHPNWNASTLPGPTALHTALHLDNKHYHRLHAEQLITAAHQRLSLIRSGQDPDADPRWLQPRWNVSCKLEDDEGHPIKAETSWEHSSSGQRGLQREEAQLSLVDREVRWEEEKRRENAEREERERKQEERRAAWREWERKEQWNADVSPIIALPSAERRQQRAAAAALAVVDNKEALLNHLRAPANAAVAAAPSSSSPPAASSSSCSLQPSPYYLYSHPGHYGWRDETVKCWSCCQSAVETARGCVVVANSQRKVRLIPVTQRAASRAAGGSRRRAAEEQPLGLVVRYEHEGVWESSRAGDVVWQWSCCGLEEKEGRGCVARPLVREDRWNLE